MKKPTHPIKEAEIRIEAILDDDDTFCPSPIGDQLVEIGNLLSVWLRDNGFDEVGNPPAGVLYFELFHGRKSKKEKLDDWGSSGPIFGPLEYVHTTYASHIKFAQNGECCDLFTGDDLIYYDGVWYGDWSVFTLDGKDEVQLREIKSRVTPYVESKARR